MARKNDSVELVISAKNETDKSFDEVKKSLDEITAALAKKGGFSSFFDGLEKQIEGVVAKKKKVDEALSNTAAIQKAIDKQKAYVESIALQEKTVSKAQLTLAELKDEYVEIEKAATAARVPSEKLTKSIATLAEKQGSLGAKIASTRQELEQSNKALSLNAGLDDKANAAIAKQEAVVFSAGKAWRDITKEVGLANKALSGIGTRRDDTSTLKAESATRLTALKAELTATKELAAEIQKRARKSDAGESTKSLAVAAKTRIAQLTSEFNAERQVQAELTRQMSSLNAEFKKQEGALDKSKAKAAAQKKVYDELKTAVAGFITVQKQEGTNRQQSSIDAITKSLQLLETQYADTGKRIAAANVALNAATSVDPKAVATRDAYRVKIEQAVIAVQKEKQSLTELKAKMDAAGLSTAALSARQKELDAATAKLTADQTKLATQLDAVDKTAKRTGNSIGGIGKTFLGIGNDTRQSLGYLQRIRGELLSIVATTTGLYAIGGAIKNVYDNSVLLSKAESRFSVFFKGDTNAAKKEIEFVEQLTDKLKIDFKTALDEYSKFAAGVDSTKVPLEQVRATFQGFAVAARAGRISADDFAGIMRAVTQIFSKQSVQLEDLQGQLAERLPGAIDRTAKALGITTEKMRDLISKGQLGAEAATLLAVELQKTFGVTLADAVQAPDAALAEFQNTITKLSIEVGKSGFIEELTKGLRSLNGELKKPETKEGILKIAQGFTELIKAGVWIVQNFDKVVTLLELAFGAKIALGVINFTLAVRTNIIALQAWAVTATAAGSVIGGAVGKIALALRFLSGIAVAAAAGYGIGTWLRDQFAIVRKYGYYLIAMFDLIGKSFTILAKVVTGKLSIADAFVELRAATDEIATDVADMFDVIDKGLDKQKPIIDADAEKKNIEEIKAEAAKLEELLSPEAIAKLQKEAIKTKKGLTESELSELENSIRDALNNIDREIQEKSANTLTERLDAINLEYTKLLKKIEKAKAAGSNIDAGAAKQAISQVVAIKQVEEAEKEVNRLIEERRTAVARINELSNDGTITVEEATKRINAENARILPQMNEALAKAREISETVNSKPISQSVSNLESKAALDEQRASKEQLIALEARLNNEMSLRRDKIETINALVSSGTISELNGKNQIIALNEQTELQTADLIAQIETLIASNKELSDSFFGQEVLERMKQAKIELNSVKTEIVNAGDLNESFASGMTNAFDGFIQGTMSARDAFRSFIADFLRQIAKAIIQQLILNAISGGAGGKGGLGGAIAGVVNGASHHTGGVVGSGGKARKIPLTAFAAAIKYHSGGIAGLKPNEVPAVLEKGEEVLTRNDPRHVMNGGSNSSGVQVKIVNAIDSASVLNEALNSSAGQKTLINAIRANKSSVRSVLA